MFVFFKHYMLKVVKTMNHCIYVFPYIAIFFIQLEVVVGLSQLRIPNPTNPNDTSPTVNQSLKKGKRKQIKACDSCSFRVQEKGCHQADSCWGMLQSPEIHTLLCSRL